MKSCVNTNLLVMKIKTLLTALGSARIVKNCDNGLENVLSNLRFIYISIYMLQSLSADQ